MPDARAREAFVVGSGPNGLAAAIESARAGLNTVVIEQSESPGGGVRSAALTLPGFVHDVCSAIYPMAVASPFFRSLDLERFGLKWLHPSCPLAHPFDDGTAALLERSVTATAATLGQDGPAYERLFGPLVGQWDEIVDDILAPLHVPRHPWATIKFGLPALLPATTLARLSFREGRARALFAGLAAHSFLSLDQVPSAAFGLVLGICGHAVGWPVPAGGSRRLTDALVSCLQGMGGAVITGKRVESLAAFHDGRFTLLDVTPRQLLRMAGDLLGSSFGKKLGHYRYGPGVFKVDWALDGPIPWRATACLRAGTVHLGGTAKEIVESERQVSAGQHPERPFVLLAQQSQFDPSRAPAGKHTGWAYCHVPNGSTFDMTARIEAQVERFAPGFRDRILARHTHSTADLELYNPNCVGGDINGGLADWRQVFFRPVPRMVPYATGIEGVYLCSASTPPGGGVHGMCGYHAARAALRKSALAKRER